MFARPFSGGGSCGSAATPGGIAARQLSEPRSPLAPL